MSNTPEQQSPEEFEAEFREWMEKLERQREATRQAEMLTAEDYGITINTID